MLCHWGIINIYYIRKFYCTPIYREENFKAIFISGILTFSFNLIIVIISMETFGKLNETYNLEHPVITSV